MQEQLVEKRSLFKPRLNLKPYEYPELLDFKDAIRHSYWLHTEYNFTPDVQDFHVNVSPAEKSALTKCMLAISQVEVNVKRFWSNLYNYFPKPEIDMVGTTFGESEVRHADAYSALLERLGLNELFADIQQIPALMGRIEYMERFMARKNQDQQGFVLSLVLFSLFVEHISLFGQFLIMMSFNKHEMLFKGLSNAIEATSKEEEIHGRFGIALYQILREENPELFTEEFFTDLKTLANDAYEAEQKILDWIFEEGDLRFLTGEEVRNYIAYRYNKSLTTLGLEAPYEVDQEMYRKVEWFDIEVIGLKDNDNFVKRNTEYTKKAKQITADDLFYADNDPALMEPKKALEINPAKVTIHKE